MAGVYTENYTDQLGMIAYTVTRKNSSIYLTDTLLSLHQYCLGNFWGDDGEIATLYQLIRKAGIGRLIVYSKTSDTATSVSNSLISYLAQDGLEPNDKNNKVVASFSGKV